MFSQTKGAKFIHEDLALLIAICPGLYYQRWQVRCTGPELIIDFPSEASSAEMFAGTVGETMLGARSEKFVEAVQYQLTALWPKLKITVDHWGFTSSMKFLLREQIAAFTLPMPISDASPTLTQFIRATTPTKAEATSKLDAGELKLDVGEHKKIQAGVANLQQLKLDEYVITQVARSHTVNAARKILTERTLDASAVQIKSQRLQALVRTTEGHFRVKNKRYLSVQALYRELQDTMF
jgi:hypothetical protein